MPPTSSTAPPARPVRRGTHRVLFASVAIGWILVDQLSKSWAVHNLTSRDVDLVGSLRLNLAFNSGASFSMGGGLGPWIGLIALVIVGVLIWQARSTTSRLAAVALGMIVGGAVGNVLDRAFRSGSGGFMGGAVVDFIDLQWWPVFNVADVGVVVGAILLVVSTFFPGPDDEEPESDPGPEPPSGRAPADDDAPVA